MAWARWGRSCGDPRPSAVRRGRGRGGAAAGVAAAVLLPLGYVDHVRAVNAGIDLRSAAEWARDAAIGLATWTAGVGVAYTACLAIGRRARTAVARGRPRGVGRRRGVRGDPAGRHRSPLRVDAAAPRPCARDAASERRAPGWGESRLGLGLGCVVADDRGERVRRRRRPDRAHGALRHGAATRAGRPDARAPRPRARPREAPPHPEGRALVRRARAAGAVGRCCPSPSARPGAAASTAPATRAPRRWSWPGCWWPPPSSLRSRTASRAGTRPRPTGSRCAPPATAPGWPALQKRLALADLVEPRPAGLGGGAALRPPAGGATGSRSPGPTRRRDRRRTRAGS